MLTKMTDGSLTRSQPHTGKTIKSFNRYQNTATGKGTNMAFLTQLPGKRTTDVDSCN